MVEVGLTKVMNVEGDLRLSELTWSNVQRLLKASEKWDRDIEQTYISPRCVRAKSLTATPPTNRLCEAAKSKYSTGTYLREAAAWGKGCYIGQAASTRRRRERAQNMWNDLHEAGYRLE